MLMWSTCLGQPLTGACGVVAILFLAQVAAGAEPSGLEFHSRFTKHISSKWPDTKLRIGAADDCPNVNAHAKPVADIVFIRESADDLKTEISVAPSNVFLIRPPQQRIGVSRIDAKDIENVHFVIVPGSIEVVASRNGAVVDRMVLSSSRGDFVCKNGVALLAPSKFGGSGESGTSNFIATIEIAVAENRAVIYRQVLTRESSDLGFRGAPHRAERYFRFRSAQIDQAGSDTK